MVDSIEAPAVFVGYGLVIPELALMIWQVWM